MKIPQAFSEPIQAQFSDCDAQKIVFFARYFSWAHDAIENFIRHGGLFKAWFESPKVAAPLRHVEGDYHGPLALGESAQALVYVSEVGQTSATFEVHFVKNKKAVAIIRTVHVFVDQKTFKPVQIPKNIRGWLLAQQS